MPKEKRQRRKERDELLAGGTFPADMKESIPRGKAEESSQSRFAIDPASVDPSEQLGAGDDDQGSVSTYSGRMSASEVGRALRDRKQKMPAVQWKYVLFGGAGVMFLAFLTHLFSINGGLVLHDRANLFYIFASEAMKLVADQSMGDLWTRPLAQPWTKASFLTDRGDWGTQFAFYHMNSLFIHVFAVGYFFLFLVRFCRHLVYQGRLNLNPYYVSIAAAAVFACHPMACESISYLSARSSLLGTVNFFLALNCLLFGMFAVNFWVKSGAYAGLVLATLMALWSSPEMICLPLVCLVTLIMVRGPVLDFNESLKKNPFAATMLVAAAIGAPALLLTGPEYTEAVDLFMPYPTSVGYWATQIKAFVFYYLRCFLFPFGLSIDPPAAVATGFTDPYVIGAIAILGVLGYLLSRLRKEALVGYALVLVGAAFLPHALMIQKDQVADWVGYLGLAGFSLLFAWGFVKVASTNIRKGFILFCAVIFLFVDLSIFRDSQWSSDLSLWKTALEQRPKSARARGMYAIELVKQKKYDEAEKEAKLALAYNPSSVIARIAAGKVDIGREKYAQALESFDAASKLATAQALPAAVQVECRFGMLEAMIRSGQVRESQPVYEKILRDAPGDPRLFYLLAVGGRNAGNIQKAYGFLRSASQLDPTMVEPVELAAQIAFDVGAYDQAFEDAQRWQQLSDSRDARMLLARMAAVTKRTLICEAMVKKMVAENPKDAEAMYLLSRVYKRNGKIAEADKWKLDAVQIEPKIEEKFSIPELPMEEIAPEKSAPPAATTEQSRPPNATPEQSAPAEKSSEIQDKAPTPEKSQDPEGTTGASSK